MLDRACRSAVGRRASLARTAAGARAPSPAPRASTAVAESCAAQPTTMTLDSGTIGPMSPLEIRAHLQELAQERMSAAAVGLTADAAYMADLELEVLEYRLALVGAVVTEIATLRGELFGRNIG
jgi:hypothetical protein